MRLPCLENFMTDNHIKMIFLQILFTGDMLSQFGFVLLFMIAAMVFVVLMLGVGRLMRPNRPGAEKLTTYESGEEAEGNAWVSFNIRFYIVALIFILFDVELVLLFPWATVFGDKSLIESTNGMWAAFAGVEMAVFIFILALGLVYAWAQGHLEWIRPEQKKSDFKPVVPRRMYEAVNRKFTENEKEL